MTTKSCFSKTLNLNIIQYKHHYHHHHHQHHNKQATATLNIIHFVRTKKKKENIKGCIKPSSIIVKSTS